MKTAELNDVLLYNNRLVVVTGIMVGKVVVMEELELAHIGGPSIFVLENSPLFQENAKPAKTIKEK